MHSTLMMNRVKVYIYMKIGCVPRETHVHSLSFIYWTVRNSQSTRGISSSNFCCIRDLKSECGRFALNRRSKTRRLLFEKIEISFFYLTSIFTFTRNFNHHWLFYRIMALLTFFLRIDFVVAFYWSIKISFKVL